ncbi:hypothetical protein BS78_09G250500 [Paspalum vaginatum]|nr:hypothetical protein BS78_09G250500 [Paspalum vaginatum]
MSGGGGGRGAHHHGIYGDPAAAGGFTTAAFAHDDDLFFLHSPPYPSIADYLQGFLDPAGLPAHFDDAPPRLVGDDYVVVKQEMAAPARLGRPDDGGQQAAGAPVTPNSSVRSSSSCEEGPGDDEQRRRRRCKKGSRPDPEEEGEQEGDDAEEGSIAPAADDRNCKRSKEHKQRGETTKTKKPREPRVAFMTRSEVDHLEDGYRWRKYGQKAVKNSSYPRSYYRCTAARCGVKKRVERSQQDPSTVITTYEGQHTHQSPAVSLLRGTDHFHVLTHSAAYRTSPLLQQLGLRPDLLDGAGAPATTPSSLLLPLVPGGQRLPPVMHLLHQEHRRRDSSQLDEYAGAVLGSIPSSAMSNGHQ